MTRQACLMIMFCVLSAPVFAQDCQDAVDQASLNACASDGFVRADGKLNDVYQQVTGQLRDDPLARALLVQAQRAWIVFRDAECAFAGSAMTGGSAYPMVLSGCLESITLNRINDLERYLSCTEGDLSCPAN